MGESQARTKNASNTCGICSKVVNKRRILPCEDEFCKKCLKRYISSFTTRSGSAGSFPCPVCKKLTDVPNDKISKAFKPDKRTQFYTNLKVIPGADVNNSYQGSYDHTLFFRPKGRNFVHSMTRRTPRLYSGNRCDTWFSCKLSSDKRGCVFWGGDTFANGDIVLADWLNRSVKVFNRIGEFVSKITLEGAPLDVSSVQEKCLVVSFGSCLKKVVYLTYANSTLYKSAEIDFKGHLYSTTRFEKVVLGVYEEQATVCLKTLKTTNSPHGEPLQPFVIHGSIIMSSASGLFYCHKLKRIFVTTNRTLYCLHRSGHAIFERSYHQHPSSELYLLCSVTCDHSGVIYVASDNCLLRLRQNGELIGVIPAKMDPYYIIMSSDSSKIALLGLGDDIDKCVVDIEVGIHN